MHQLGNLLVFPCHYGVNQFIRTFDPFRRKRSHAMHQFPFIIEIFSRPFRFIFGFIFALIGLPLAILGQGLKVSVSAAGKELYTHYHYESAAHTEPLLNDDHTADISQLKVYSMNLAAMHSLARWHNGTRPVQPRMEEMVQHILNKKSDQAPDVICFQEVFTEKATDILVKGLRERYPYIIHNVGKNIIGVNSGLMLLSKYPITDISFSPFTIRHGQNALSQKGVLNAVIKLPADKNIVVTNTHLEAGGKLSREYVVFGRGFDTSAVKELQMTEALKAANEIAPTKQPLLSIFAGDLNAPLKADSINNVQQCLLTHQYQNPATANTYQSTCLKKRILDLTDDFNTNYKNKGRGDYLTAKYHTPRDIEENISIDRETKDISDHVGILGKFSL